MLQLLKNLLLTLATVLEHARDEPVILVLQVSRRLPAQIIRPAAEAVYRLAGKRTLSVPGILAAYMTGRSDEVETRLLKGNNAGVQGVWARRLADIAISTGHAAIAAKLLMNVDASVQGAAGTLARLKWHYGDMGGAVVALEGARGGQARQRDRLASELRVFKGWSPTIKPGRIQPVERRVLHVLTNSLPHTGSGYAQRSHSILAAQRDLGWDVKAVTRLGYPVQVGKLFARETDMVDGIEYQRLLPSKLRHGVDERLQQQTEALAAIVRNFRPTAIHTTTHFVNGLVVREVAEKCGIPWIYEVRGQLADTWAAGRSDDAKDSERYKMFQAREVEVMQSADLVVTLGDAMCEAIVRSGVPMDKILLAPNAVGESYLQEPLPRSEARRRLDMPEEGTLIGTVSSLVDYEGIDDLIDAFAILAPRFPELKVLIVGEGVAGPALRSQAQALGLADRVIFTGRVSRTAAALYHQALDVFVVPRKDLDVTRAVPPLKPVEAMASSRPVVASRLPALSESVRHEFNGLLVRAEDPRALAEALSRLVRDSDVRAQFGAAGRRFVLSERTWEMTGEKYVRAYQSLRVES